MSCGVNFTNFVEEKCSAISGFEATNAFFIGASEGALFVPEELTLKEIGVESCAVNGNESFFGTSARRVDSFGNDLFTRTTFTSD